MWGQQPPAVQPRSRERMQPTAQAVVGERKKGPSPGRGERNSPVPKNARVQVERRKPGASAPSRHPSSSVNATLLQPGTENSSKLSIHPYGDDTCFSFAMPHPPMHL